MNHGKINDNMIRTIMKVNKEISNLPGFEPGIFCSVGRRVIRCATGPARYETMIEMESVPLFVETALKTNLQ